MIKDERISATKNRIGAQGFGIWYILLLGILLYRQFYLGQSVSQYWDIAAIFFVGTLYVVIANFAQGAFTEQSHRLFIFGGIPIGFVTILGVLFYRNQITSAIDFIWVGAAAIGSVSLFGFVFYLLNRRWKKKNGLIE